MFFELQDITITLAKYRRKIMSYRYNLNIYGNLDEISDGCEVFRVRNPGMKKMQ